MAEEGDYEELLFVSHGLYIIANDIIGPECIVKLRRQKADISDVMNSWLMPGYTRIMGGSTAEGMHLKSSDLDFMYIHHDSVVLEDKLFLQRYENDFSYVLQIETDGMTPGFAFVKLLTRPSAGKTESHIESSLVRLHGGLYLNSKVYRNFTTIYFASTIPHGPSRSGVVYTGFEYDKVFGLQCAFWPKQAQSLIHRSRRRGWPSKELILDMCQDGCLIVPVDSKSLYRGGTGALDLEWRISFSLAEKKLMYSMNHCQFLCYGLLKILLNDVIKKTRGNEDLLSSYHMKTAVFWEIQEDGTNWSEEYLLFKFWKSFRRIVHWVSIGYCPNFWIPENNMFSNKIYGRHRNSLMSVLSAMHKDGILCIFKAFPFREALKKMWLTHTLPEAYSTDENGKIFEYLLESNKLITIFAFDNTVPPDLHWAVQNLIFTKSASIMNSSKETATAFILRANAILQRVAELLFCPSVDSNDVQKSNKERLKEIKTARRMLQQFDTCFCSSYAIHAKCLYSTGQYHKAIEMAKFVIFKLQVQPFTYRWELEEEVVMPRLKQGMSQLDLFNKHIVKNFRLQRETTIEELLLESSHLVKPFGRLPDVIEINPLVFLYFLLVLCYDKLGEIKLRSEALFDLRTLVNYPGDHHINPWFRPITWQILGICQQLCGDHFGAFHSYIQALNDKHIDFTKATIFRILVVVWNCHKRYGKCQL
ncbi:hypothetical protein FSP39_023335 [Pinctada imbricata]|uniref:Mab-21-like HhH/H2TH-like domain-containing protein n=1 Tax=Pinctada imbricata TaxID=66713 RepID=A0AA88XKA0_PINIB|nr:hypothetical protein FSP39_023335 [Pinctada imbricata]